MTALLCVMFAAGSVFAAPKQLTLATGERPGRTTLGRAIAQIISNQDGTREHYGSDSTGASVENMNLSARATSTSPSSRTTSRTTP